MAHELYWYLGYGSNLSRERFICYIKGGTPKYGKVKARGCADKKFLDIWKPYKIDRKLYFALPKGRKATSNWGTGGVAFLDLVDSPEHTALCRIWKVTSDQFLQIWEQEGRDWYNELHKLGTVDGMPVFTFTRRTPGLSFKVNLKERPPDNKVQKPSSTYLKTIMEGLIETFPRMDKKEVVRYLLPMDGIEGNYDYVELGELYDELNG